MRFLISIFILYSSIYAATLAPVDQFDVAELTFFGPNQTMEDAPAVDIDFYVDFKHESGEVVRVHGFWDGDGKGGMEGSVFKVRFCPFLAGTWILEDVYSNAPELREQRENDLIVVQESDHPGFWVIDEFAPGQRWFKRSNGTHDYIVGNTHYDFLGAPDGVVATHEHIESDIEHNAKYFKKLRFCVRGFRSENKDPDLRPFFRRGKMTSSETNKPNPKFFRERVDVAVQKGYELDLICDLILGGTTGDQVADSLGFIKYMAARYGAYPNVWFCIGQEWDEQADAEHEVRIGSLLNGYTPFPNPISTHATEKTTWNSDLWGSWYTHSIRQGKLPSHLKNMPACAEAMIKDYASNQGRPTVNDENGYDPNESTEDDVLEGVLGTFAGGGYGTTGHKLASKEGGYFWGYASQDMTADEHPSADNLGWMREKIDATIDFWRLEPRVENSIPILEWPEVQKVVFSNKAMDLTENLDGGPWKVVQFDVINKTENVLSEEAQGEFGYTTPASRAVMTFFENLNPVQVESEHARPQQFSLAQNYPNPFNPETRITYSVGRTAHVILNVYNTLGQNVARLVDERQPAGSYSATFDGRNLPSGLYFYQLVIDKQQHLTKKMLLAK